jgi:ribosomal protein S27AE
MKMKICPKCQGNMSKGLMFHTDQTYKYKLGWLSGKIKSGFWGGSTVKSDTIPQEIAQYSCDKCGYIESYVVNDD